MTATHVFESFADPQIERRAFLLGGLFCSAAAIAAWRMPRVKATPLGEKDLENIVPKSIGPWSFVAASGLVVPSQDLLAGGLYSEVLTRVYSDGQNPPVMLLMAYSSTQTGFLQVHRPEFCYTATGYKISPVTPHAIQLGSRLLQASKMDASAGAPPEHIVYWTRIGDHMPISWVQQKIAVAEENLRGMVPDAILIRVSLVSEDSAAAFKNIDAFVRALLKSVGPQRQSLFVV